jgi:hypothetical protein
LDSRLATLMLQACDFTIRQILIPMPSDDYVCHLMSTDA